MSLVEKTEPSQTDALAFEIDLHHAPAKVWRALTEPALLTEWLLPVVGHRLALGAEFKLTAQPQPGWDGVVHCRVLEITEQRALSYAWVVGELDTVVRFELAPTDAGTRLTIVQSGFEPSQKQNFGGARYGWKMMSGKLIDLLERTA